MKIKISQKQLNLILASSILILKLVIAQQSFIECQAEQQFLEYSTQQCTTCLTYCQYCKDNVSCLACSKGTYLDLDLSCQISCQNGYFMDDNSQKCVQCSDSKCIKCKSTNQCTQCMQGYQVSPDGTTCLDVYCSDFYGQFDSLDNRCSLDGYFYFQNKIQINDNQEEQTQFVATNFNYSSQKQDSYGDLIDIQIISVFSQTFVIGIKYYQIVIYDFQNMKSIYTANFSQPVQQIKLIKNQLFLLIGQYIETQNYYSNIQIIQLDMANFKQKQIYYSTDQYQELILEQDQLFLKSNSYCYILLLKSLQIQQLYIKDMNAFSYFQNEGILLISSLDPNIVYFTNNQFTSFNQVILPIEENFKLISLSHPQSIIITLSNDNTILKVYNLSQNFDNDNQIQYQLGSVIQQINYSNQEIQQNEIQNAIYLISDKDIQVWISSNLQIQIELISSDTQYFIREQSIIIKNNQELIVYDSSFSQIKFSIPFSSQITQMQFFKNSILFSVGNDIQVISLDEQGKQTYIYQSFAFNNNIQHTYGKVQQIIFDQITNQKIILILEYNFQIYQLSKFDKTFNLSIGSKIQNSLLFGRTLYVISSNQIVETNIDNYNVLIHTYNTNYIMLVNQDSLGLVLKCTSNDDQSQYLITVDQQNNFSSIYLLQDNNLNIIAKEGQILIFSDSNIRILDYNFQEKVQLQPQYQIQNIYLIDGIYSILWQNNQISIIQSQNANNPPVVNSFFIGVTVVSVMYSSATKKLLVLNAQPGSQTRQTFQYYNLQNPLNQQIDTTSISLSEIDLIVYSYCFSIVQNVVQYLDLSTKGTEYTQITFQNQVSTVESINQQNLFLIRFLNVKNIYSLIDQLIKEKQKIISIFFIHSQFLENKIFLTIKIQGSTQLMWNNTLMV
ncbi:hypothetical protein TTHERM_00845770 (macronuclear) [Tetrahymena thermophila SB210]|uniref:Transmembrane protein n=1 Tax=Tetrahymena thermophila (strain SB210) TaxID=312017 RepID=Q22UV4_TETTS|nr:hypothetical protein TTHERM_00845770 [Tetrahymena thermophila SB210]EAR89022.2 hypothetical protein TTHERM_00845770 [Tetrahymena thermophila SB210]|eukprot:XP_001009267.2 hypothetical protein TTHERM_00845770 [Tetrahymena thermophila SB210]